MSDWFPIEIIPPPKDGTSIDVWAYPTRYGIERGSRWTDARWIDGAWEVDEPHEAPVKIESETYRISHWMPIPERPK